MFVLQILFKYSILTKLYFPQHGRRLPGTWRQLVPARLDPVVGHLPISKSGEYAVLQQIVSGGVHASGMVQRPVRCVHGCILSMCHAIAR